MLTTAAMVGALSVIATPLWQFAAKPVLVGAVSEAVAQDLDQKVQDTVKAEIAPIERKVQAGNAGLKAIIQGNITGLENDISRLEFVRDQPPPGDWTDDLRRELLSKQRALAIQRAALEQIFQSEQ